MSSDTRALWYVRHLFVGSLSPLGCVCCTTAGTKAPYCTSVLSLILSGLGDDGISNTKLKLCKEERWLTEVVRGIFIFLLIAGLGFGYLPVTEALEGQR